MSRVQCIRNFWYEYKLWLKWGGAVRGAVTPTRDFSTLRFRLRTTPAARSECDTGNRNCHSIRLRLSLCCPDPRWGISSRLFLERATDLYYFFIQILYRLFESYFYHVAAHKFVNLGYLQKWRQVMLNGVDEMKWKCSDLKCVRKPTKSRLSLTHHAMQTNPAVESRVKSLDGPRVRGIGPVGKV